MIEHVKAMRRMLVAGMWHAERIKSEREQWENVMRLGGKALAKVDFGEPVLRVLMQINK